MPRRKTEQLLDLIRRKRVLRARDLDAMSIPRNYLNRFVTRGQLHRVGRGIYTSEEGVPSEHVTLLEVSHRVPKAVICLLSALRFYEIGTQMPSDVWMAIDVKARVPKIDYLPVRFVRFSGEALRFGVQEHRVDNGTIRVYSLAKTVADCFKFRHKIGTEVAIEALRECYRQKEVSMNDLWEAAKVCRVANVMRPYMESLA